MTVISLLLPHRAVSIIDTIGVATIWSLRGTYMMELGNAQEMESRLKPNQALLIMPPI